MNHNNSMSYDDINVYAMLCSILNDVLKYSSSYKDLKFFRIVEVKVSDKCCCFKVKLNSWLDSVFC